MHRFFKLFILCGLWLFGAQLASAEVKWHASFQDAVKLAASAKKPILAVFR